MGFLIPTARLRERRWFKSFLHCHSRVSIVSVLVLLITDCALSVDCFSSPKGVRPRSPHRYSNSRDCSGCGRTATTLLAAAADILGRLVEIPLLDVLSSSDDEARIIIQPLPSSHLPDELTTCHVYGMQLTVPLHQRIIDHAVEQTRDQLYGHIAYKPLSDSFIGAIGCTAQVLLNSPSDNAVVIMQGSDEFDSVSNEIGLARPKTVLCRGLYRFIVREVLQSVPYAVALVEELHDDNTESEVGGGGGDAAVELQTAPSRDGEEEEEEDEDDEDEYAELTTTELMQRTLLAMKAAVDQQLDQAVTPVELSPLEESILQDQGILSQKQVSANAARQAAEENAAVFEVFQSALIDLFVTPAERYYAVAMMAAELCNLGDNAARRRMLVCTNSLQRLRSVCAQAETAVGMARARKFANAITDESAQASKELRVGDPTLPPWARSIRKGTVLEYYWNDEFEWCRGQVVADPVLVVDELIVTVYFADDDSTHRLPFRADEKARWRPPPTAN